VGGSPREADATRREADASDLGRAVGLDRRTARTSACLLRLLRRAVRPERRARKIRGGRHTPKDGQPKIRDGWHRPPGPSRRPPQRSGRSVRIPGRLGMIAPRSNPGGGGSLTIEALPGDGKGPVRLVAHLGCHPCAGAGGGLFPRPELWRVLLEWPDS